MSLETCQKTLVYSIIYNERTSIAQDTISLFGLTPDGGNDDVSHRDGLPSRLIWDNDDFIQLVDHFQGYNVNQHEKILELTTSDVASEHMLKDLTNRDLAAKSGKQMVTELVEERVTST